VTSHRDLPILINQWANVVRWEMRTRIFLRTSEFLWQEGHTVHATRAEAEERTRMMLDVYAAVAEDYLALPVIKGHKSPAERFPGAVDTLSIEAMMQDRKALQAGTSHFLGQNFARASGIKFQSAEEQEEFAWTTSWGASTRLIGGVIMTHGDDDGIILPPRVASAHIVLLPIARKGADQEPIMRFTEEIAGELRRQSYRRSSLVVEIDNRDIGGARNWEWIKKGIPLRVEIGPKELENRSVYVGRRDKPHNERRSYAREEFIARAVAILDDIQAALFQRAREFSEAHTYAIADTHEFYDLFTPLNPERPEIHGGFAISQWCGEAGCESKIKEELGVTIRCIPFDQSKSKGQCICCGRPAELEAVFAKAY
jgi:prolyl-tRNA synthetase